MKEFLETSKSIDELPKEKDGSMNLDGMPTRPYFGPGNFAKLWTLLKDGEFLVKELDSKNDPITTLVAESIARMCGLNVAKYYSAIMNRKRLIISLSFLNLGDELISGKDICGINMNIRETPELLKDYLKKNGASNEEVEEIIMQYKMSLVYSIFINNRDGHNGNWSIIKRKDGTFCFAPIYDLEGSLDENTHNIRATYIDDYDYSDEKMLDFLFQDERVLEESKKFLDIPILKIFEQIEKEKGIVIPKEKREKLYKFISSRKQVFRKFLLKESSIDETELY